MTLVQSLLRGTRRWVLFTILGFNSLTITIYLITFIFFLYNKESDFIKPQDFFWFTILSISIFSLSAELSKKSQHKAVFLLNTVIIDLIILLAFVVANQNIAIEKYFEKNSELVLTKELFSIGEGANKITFSKTIVLKSPQEFKNHSLVPRMIDVKLLLDFFGEIYLNLFKEKFLAHFAFINFVLLATILSNKKNENRN